MIIDIQSDNEIQNCFDTLKDLRPELDAANYLDYVRLMMRDGFQLSAYIHEIEGNQQAAAVIGYRIHHNFANGKKLYIDDLVTHPNLRSRGFGQQLLAYVEAKAKQQGCNLVHLDSGCQRRRAHNFYFKNGYEIWAFHFIKNV